MPRCNDSWPVMLGAALILSSCGGSGESSSSLVSPGSTGGPPVQSSSPSTTTAPSTAPTVGFDVLDVAWPAYTPDLEAELGRILVAVNADEFESLWAEVGSSRPRPDVDFDRQLVVAYLVGGSGSCREHLAGFDLAGRSAVAAFAAALPFDACTSDLNLRFHVAAVDLADLAPGPLSFTREADHPSDDVRPVDVVIPETTSAPPSTAAPPEAEVVVRQGAVPKPRSGKARSGRLDDGTPVWVVGHDDGTVTVVEATSPSSPNTFMQPPWPLHVIVNWFPGAQRFGGGSAWDAWGRSLLVPRADDLTRRAATIDGDQVVVGEPMAAVTGRPVTTQLAQGTPSAMVAPDLGDAVTIDDAMAAGTTRTIVSDPLVIATHDGRRVGRICALTEANAGATAPCPDAAPLAFDVEAPTDAPSTLSTYFGPLFVEVVDGAITRVTLVSAGITESAWTPETPGDLPANPPAADD